MLKLAVSSLTYEGYDNIKCETLFRYAYEEGYRNVEFNCWHADALTDERILMLREGCERNGLRPAALHVAAFGGTTTEQISWNTAHKLRAIDAAVLLGCRRVAASVSSDTKDPGIIIEELEQIAPYAQKRDVLICLENHCRNILAVSEDYLRIFDKIDTRISEPAWTGAIWRLQEKRLMHSSTGLGRRSITCISKRTACSERKAFVGSAAAEPIMPI